ncbi:hypothetical protein V7x_21610 [Crateriforma conspicua]|uniref:Uncharacterized protein n=1 Tax=Crateriforma conspicua TaxID=2527996 RepID=A0A5C6FU68_9PLAN|nr:hypothetical protein [Crateriforma conspicua]TWU66592.1 hypothetical protein V7x_21610 [Crateriforma conspicua]
MNDRVIAKAESMRKLRRRQMISMFVFLLTALIASLAATAFGQATYRQLPIQDALKSEAAVKQMKTALKAFSNSSEGQSSPHARAAMAYVSNYVPRRITQADATPEITELIDDVVSAIDAAQRRGNTQVANLMISKFAPMMSGVAGGNFQPAARIAATMAIGRLNSDPGDFREIPPTPYMNGFGVLKKLFETETNPDGVRAAALHGLLRYTRLTFHRLPDNVKNQLAPPLQTLLQAPVPAGRSPEAHAFMQRYAVDILELLRPDDENLATALVTISQDRNRPDLIALHSAATFGRHAGAAKAKVAAPLKTLDIWTAIAFEAFGEEVKRLEQFNQPREIAMQQPEKPDDLLVPAEERVMDASMEDGYGGDMDMDDGSYEMGAEGSDDGYGDMGMDEGYGSYGMAPVVQEYEPQPAEVVATRRRLNDVLQQIHLGVTGSAKPGMPSKPGGLLAVADDASKGKIITWVTEMETLLTDLNDKSLEETKDFLEKLTELTEQLEKMAGDAAKKPVAAPDQDGMVANPAAVDQLAGR